MSDDLDDFVSDDERLARRCFSSNKKNRPRLFQIGEKQKHKISTDRASIATEATLLELALADLEERKKKGSAKSFYGWRMLLAGKVRNNGRDVIPAPTDENQYHSNILLPKENPDIDPDEDPYLFHAQKLFDASSWKPAPSGSI